jgi:hypothetical protein
MDGEVLVYVDLDGVPHLAGHLRTRLRNNKESATFEYDVRLMPVPERLPAPPPELAVGYRREAQPVGVASSIEEAHEVLRAWLDPVLAQVAGRGEQVATSPDDWSRHLLGLDPSLLDRVSLDGSNRLMSSSVPLFRQHR